MMLARHHSSGARETTRACPRRIVRMRQYMPPVRRHLVRAHPGTHRGRLDVHRSAQRWRRRIRAGRCGRNGLVASQSGLAMRVETFCFLIHGGACKRVIVQIPRHADLSIRTVRGNESLRHNRPQLSRLCGKRRVRGRGERHFGKRAQ